MLTWKLGGVKSVDVEIEGTWTTTQKRVLGVLGLAALAWITREIPYGGWSELFERYVGTTEAGDTTVALVAVVILFLVPSGEGDGKRLLDWSTAKQIPWGVLLLFGGGIAIAKAFDASGLSTSIGSLVDRLQDWPTLAVIGTLCLLVTFFSEFTSNTATSNILMPILAAAAVANKLDPALSDVSRHALKQPGVHDARRYAAQRASVWDRPCADRRHGPLRAGAEPGQHRDRDAGVLEIAARGVRNRPIKEPLFDAESTSIIRDSLIPRRLYRTEAEDA